MLEKLARLAARFEELRGFMADPNVVKDSERVAVYHKEYKRLEEVVSLYHAHQELTRQAEEVNGLLTSRATLEDEFRVMAKEELESLNKQKERLREQMRALLVSEDPNDSRCAILEIRAGTGGDEAALFARDLWRMYTHYAEHNKWKMALIGLVEASRGGYKEVIANVTGEGVYGKMKYESGVHRVQRIPDTEAQGRIHTSAATVVVLPEMDEIAVNINMNDVRKDTYCSSGPGGQSVNTTYSAVRLTHLPTNVVVTCQDEKSQLKNFDKAMKVLRSRLYSLEAEKKEREIGKQRRSLVRSGDRSDKIRTYNYPQGRVTDHRIKYTVHNLPDVMNGSLDALINNLRTADRSSIES